jgi:hypothetical protein
MLLTIRTNASAPATYVEGALIPAAGGSEAFDEPVWIRRMQDSPKLIELLTDDAYGAGSSTLILVDSAGADVLQGYAATFLSYAHEESLKKATYRSDDRNILYGARTDTPGAAESDPNWQIFRKTLDTGVIEWANGNADFVNRYDQRESISYS